jgi:hypothetical protein
LLVVDDIWVRSFDLDYLELYWKIKDKAEDIAQYRFTVLRSEAQEGHYEKLAGPFQDTFHFRDTTVSQMRRYRQWWYRIKVEHISTSEVKVFPEVGGATQTGDDSLHGLEMARQNQLELTEFTGRHVLFFPIKTFGQVCSCVDTATDRPLPGHEACSTCYGTRYVGGYHKPIMVPAKVVTPVDQKAVTQFGESTKQNSYVKVANYPYLEPDWLMVEAENKRWRIGQRIQRTENVRAAVWQQADIHSITIGDIEFSVPVLLTPEELRVFQASPARVFSNPTDPASVGDEIYERALEAFS